MGRPSLRTVAKPDNLLMSYFHNGNLPMPNGVPTPTQNLVNF